MQSYSCPPTGTMDAGAQKHPLLTGFGQGEEIRSYRVISATGHVSHHHIWDGQNLPILCLLNEDGHPPRHQLAVVLYPLRPSNKLPI